jgi:type II secretion system protein J
MKIMGGPKFRRLLKSGFTLIEVVISAALMAIILTGAYVCLSSGISSQKLLHSRSEVIQNARVAMALMSADLRSACPLSKDIEFLGMHRMLGDVEADNLDFGTHNYTPRLNREGDFCETSYFVAKDPESGTLTLWRRRDPSPDDEPLSGGSREEIARGLSGLKFEYSDGFDWYDQWGDPAGKRNKNEVSRLDHPNLFGLPEAVRITLSLEPAGSKQLTTTTESSEAPLVFQTVARLNLASTTQQSSSAGGDSGQKPDDRSKEAAPGQGGEQ